MPLYEYTCQACEHTFEALVFDGEAVECPQCHDQQLERLWSVPANRLRRSFQARIAPPLPSEVILGAPHC